MWQGGRTLATSQKMVVACKNAASALPCSTAAVQWKRTDALGTQTWKNIDSSAGRAHWQYFVGTWDSKDVVNLFVLQRPASEPEVTQETQ